MSGIAGLRGTGDWGTDERPKDFRESILFYSPNGTAPIFALTSKAGKKTVTDPEYAWWAESNTLIRLTVSGALASGDSTVTVSSADPTSSTMDVAYGTATHLKPGDLLLVEKTDQVTFDNEIIQVDTVLSDTQFTALRGAAGTTAASIANAANLTVIGSAYAEGTGAPRATSKNPIKFTNYIQIFKDSYEITGTADNTTARTGSAWSNDKKRKLFKHSQDIEWAFMFGRKSEQTGENGKPLRFLGGLREQIPSSRTTVFSVATTAATFADAVSPVFDFDLGGGDTRMGFMGNFARVEMGKIIQGTTGIRMELGNIIKIWGIAFQEFVMPMGRLLLKSHPLLSQHARYKKSMFVVDFAAVKYVTMKGRPDGKTFDDVQNKDEDVPARLHPLRLFRNGGWRRALLCVCWEYLLYLVRFLGGGMVPPPLDDRKVRAMARMNVEGAELYDCIIKKGNRFGTAVLTLTGTTAIAADGPQVLFLDPGGSARNVTLWASPQRGDWVLIVNTADAAEVITVQTSAAGALTPAITPTQSESALVIYDGTAWHGMVMLGA